jgi:pimeloyl-ACP methyl ester carboxylesterase
MTIVDRGQGSPIVVVPSLQGRWEYLTPAIDALARTHRVITFSLRKADDLNDLVTQVNEVLDNRGLEGAAILGISFGGRVALRFAASHPERTRALVMASVPGPRFRLRPSHRVYARYPRVFAPLFFAAMPARVWAELVAAIPQARARRAFIRWQARTFLRAPLSAAQMGARALLIDGVHTAADCARVVSPTLIVSGEPRLDFVVPSTGTLEYAQLIPGSQTVTLSGTGHLGSITQPEAFAKVVSDFLASIQKP